MMMTTPSRTKSGKTLLETATSAWSKRRSGGGAYIVAPMVDQSELAFRMLCREFGAHLCYTPMIHARIFVESVEYRREIFETCEGDRPLIVQFCGNDARILQKAAELVQHQCDAIDLNLGCPQGIAKRGNYGAFLLEQVDVVEEIVRHLSSTLTIPVTCKIRALKTEQETMDLAKRIQNAGCALLTVHGRTRYENKHLVRHCDWDIIKQIKETLDIPVIANGGIFNVHDVNRCLDETGSDGVMASESILENPALFCNNYHPETGKFYDQIDLAHRYLDLAEQYRSHNRQVRSHLFKILFGGLEQHQEFQIRLARTSVLNSTFMSEMRDLVDELRQHFPADHQKEHHDNQPTHLCPTKYLNGIGHVDNIRKLSEQQEYIALHSSGILTTKIAQELHSPSSIQFPFAGSWYYRHNKELKEADCQEDTSSLLEHVPENVSTLAALEDALQKSRHPPTQSDGANKPSEDELRSRASSLKKELIRKHRQRKDMATFHLNRPHRATEEQDTSVDDLFGQGSDSDS